MKSISEVLMPKQQESTRGSGERTAGRRIDPVQADIRDLTAYFATDTEVGISPKEAERRFLRSTVGALFSMDKPKPASYVLPILKEPVMWLLLVVGVVACLFDRADVGLPAILLMLLHGAVCVLMSVATGRLERQMQVYDAPLARVVRNRRILRVPADRVVAGDIILLRRGDVIPADARLITSHRLTVAEDTLDGDARRRETVCLDKCADEMPQDVPHRHSPVNMVYAGGIVKRGSAKALVTAVGRRTHLGGLMGKIPCSHDNALPKALQANKKRLSVFNLVLAVTTVPLTAVGIFTVGDRYDLLDLFAMALALSVLTLTEHVFVFGAYLSTALRQRAARDPDVHLSCDIRNTQTLENLSQMDHLILMGTSALEDGTFFPESVLTCDKTYICGQSASDSAMIAFSEKMYLYAEGLKAWDDDLAAAVERMTAWAQPDVEKLKLQLSSVVPCGEGVRVTMKNGEVTDLYLYPVGGVHRDMPRCGWMRYADTDDEGQALCAFDAKATAEWSEWIFAAEKQSKRVFALVSESNDMICAEGLIAFETETCPKTKGVLAAFASAGIQVTVFLSCHDRWEHTYQLREAGLLNGREEPYGLTQESAEEIAALAQNGVRVFSGSVPKDAVDYIRFLHKQGAVVGALSVDAHDVDVLSAADIAMTCLSPDLREGLIKQTAVAASGAWEADGYPDGSVSTDLSRYTADVLIRRCSAHGGGVCGVRRALLTAEQMSNSGKLAFRYVLLSQILRVCMAFLPMFMGLTVLPVSLLLFSGFCVDLLALLCYTAADVPAKLTPRSTEKGSVVQERQRPSVLSDLPVSLGAVTVTAISCVIPWIFALVAKLMNISLGADVGYFGMLCLIGSQIALLIAQKLPRRRRIGFFAAVLAVCVYMSAISVALAGGLSILWCLLIPLLQPLFLFVAIKICDRKA